MLISIRAEKSATKTIVVPKTDARLIISLPSINNVIPRQPISGIDDSVNLLIGESNYELIARQDSDDESFKERLETQLNIMKKHNLDACTTLAKIDELKKTRPFLSHLFPKKLIIKYKNPFIHGSLLIKKRVLENVGMYDEKFKFAQDYKLMSDLIRLNHKLKIINQPLYKLNTIDNISTNNIVEQNHYANCVKKEIDP